MADGGQSRAQFISKYSVNFRQACVARQFDRELPPIGSLSHVFCKQGIHIVANPKPKLWLTARNFIEPGD